MAVLSFDTFTFIQELKQVGIDEKHAEAIVSGLQKIELNQVASKEDIAALKENLKELELRIMNRLYTALFAQAALIVALIKFL